MTLSVDLYCPGRSWLHRLDPRTKLVMAACGVAMLLAMHSVALIAAMLVLVHLALVSARIPWARIKAIWQLTAPTMVLIVLLGSLIGPHQGPNLVTLWGWGVSVAAVANALATALRIAALALVISVWLFTTSQSTLVRGLVALGLPYPFGLALAMALRFIPAIAASFHTISDAQRARALDLSKGGPVRRARAYVPIGVAVIITSLRAAENLSRALSARAFASDTHHTELLTLTFGWRDAAITLGTIVIATAFLWARWALGLGASPLGL
jgi:energy-coupling factor transport system permease protein